MKEIVCVGQVYTAHRQVTEKDTALYLGSGDLEVFGTPALIAFMEYAAKELLKPSLSDEETSVGIEIQVKHLKANKRGDALRAEAKIMAVDGKRISFHVEVFQGDTLVGAGTHQRVIVSKERFMEKLR